MANIEKTFRAGAVSATVWVNEAKSKEGQDITFKTISLERRYQDKEGNWKTTSNLRLNDLPKLSLVADQAYKHLVLTSA